MEKINSSTLIDLVLSFSKKDRVSILIGILNRVSEGERLSLYKKIVPRLSISERKKHCEILSSSLISKAHWVRINKWMESMFMNHYNYTPYKVAMVAMNYFRVNRKMKPFMIAHARRVKKRVYYKLKSRKNGCDDKNCKQAEKL